MLGSRWSNFLLVFTTLALLFAGCYRSHLPESESDAGLDAGRDAGLDAGADLLEAPDCDCAIEPPSCTRDFVIETVDRGRLSNIELQVEPSGRVHMAYYGAYNYVRYANALPPEPWSLETIFDRSESEERLCCRSSFSVDRTGEVHLCYGLLADRGTVLYARRERGEWNTSLVGTGLRACVLTVDDELSVHALTSVSGDDFGYAHFAPVTPGRSS